MNIGDVAKQSGLPAKTIRYYEDIGFVTPARSDNGYRWFAQKDLHQFDVCPGGRGRWGFRSKPVPMLLALYEDQGPASGQVKAVAQKNLSGIHPRLRICEPAPKIGPSGEPLSRNNQPDVQF